MSRIQGNTLPPLPKRLLAKALLAVLVVFTVLPASSSAEIARPSSSPSAGQAARLEKERRILVCVNHERTKRGIAPLAYDPSLARAARLHAENMRRYRFFDHVDPWGRGPSERVAMFTNRFYGAGENIAMGYPYSGAACRGWMQSTGHRANILDPDYAYIGTGYTGGAMYWVQVFGVLPVGPPGANQ